MSSQGQTIVFKQRYEEAIKANPEADCLKVIQQLNKQYKIDRVILRQAINAHPKKQQLEASSEYQTVREFYRHLFESQEQIERSYLKVDLNQKVQNSDGDHRQQNATYALNRNSISKFLQDQSQHYQKQFQKLSKMVNFDEKGINGQVTPQFLKQLFTTDYTIVIHSGKNFFQQEASYVEESIQKTLKNFYYKDKQLDQTVYVSDNFWIMEAEILQFIDYWARQQSSNNMFVLYARSKKRLQMESDFLTAQYASRNSQIPIQHPSQMPSENLGQSKIQIFAEHEDDNEFRDVEIQQVVQEENTEQQQKSGEKVKKKSRKQGLQQKMRQLFDFGCKRRYPLPKGTTFDQLQTELTTMNLEKFIGFCNYYHITNEIISRDLLTEMFKSYALNLRILDFERFKNLIHRMVESDKRVVDKLLFRSSPIKQNIKKVQSQLGISTFKLGITSPKGKDRNTLQEQLAQYKQRKRQLSLVKKQKPKRLHPHFSRQRKLPKMNSQITLPDKTTIFQLEKIRDQKFDLSQLIDNSEDPLWDVYEAKIWKKSPLITTIEQDQIDSRQISTHSNKAHISGLDILDRRLMQGEKVLKRFKARKQTERGKLDLYT